MMHRGGFMLRLKTFLIWILEVGKFSPEKIQIIFVGGLGLCKHFIVIYLVAL